MAGLGFKRYNNLMDFQETNWYQYMEPVMREMATESYRLLDHAKTPGMTEASFGDFGYVVFPMAKAYEGFLKKLFLDLKLIDRRQFFGDHFRIGRALNPNLPKRYRDGWVYGKLVEWCSSEALPELLWDAWKEGRNKVFHYFPEKNQKITLEEAEALISQLSAAMSAAVDGCRV